MTYRSCSKAFDESTFPCSDRRSAPFWRAAGIVVVTAALAACSPTASAPRIEGPAAEVRNLTGAHTRIVWVQGDGSDPYAIGENLVLMGFDTDDGLGERVILGEPGSYVKPLLTPGGDRIIYSTGPRQPGGPQIFILNWDGSGLRRLAEGFALTVWQDPADGREWLYVGSDNVEFDFQVVSRFPIDNPDSREVVWDRSLVSGDTFQVSADGTLAGGLFPWPEAGVAELPNGEWRKLGEGCWTALGNPAGEVFWYFDGAHRNLTLVDVETDRRWMVSISDAPGFEGAEVYHPRWTNHPRFLAMTGPYNQGGANQVRSGGTQAEVYLGRFSADFTRVESWVQVTHNSSGDSYPDVWIDRTASPHVMRAAGPVGPALAPGEEAGFSDPGRVTLRVRLVDPGPVPTPQDIEPYRNALVVNDYEVLEVLDGEYDRARVLVAQWAIRERRVLATARRTPGTIHRLTLELYDARPELEGERLIAAGRDLDLPLYYDLDS